MSHSKNQELDSWKAVLARLRCTETTWRGTPLSGRDQDTYTEAILCNALVLVDLSNRYPGLGTRRDHVNWALSCARVDVDDLARFLTDAILLLRTISLGPDESGITWYDDFKHRLAAEYPFAGTLLGTVSEAIDLYCVRRTPGSFYPVYQFLSFLTHLSLLDLDMAEELEAEYLKNEELVQQLVLPTKFVEQMNEVMRGWLKDFRVTEETFSPKHGPGAVAELTGDRSLYSKYHFLSSDARIDYVFRKFAGLDVRTYFVPGLERDVPTSRESQIVFVPKSMRTKRVISKEPVSLMFLQQGVSAELNRYVRHHRYLRHKIDLNDQSKQRLAALEASSTRRSATVDLSAASDSVSWELVKRVFRGTSLLPFLVALRSQSTVLPSGRVVSMRKFAPMGSALCFPIETLIFACIAECTLRYVHAVSGISDYQYRVYGDDIIIPDHCFYDLEHFLRWCGFRINASKSYGGNFRFRESCGCDAYDGVDVTCMKIGRRFAAGQVASKSPSLFAGIVRMANVAHVYGFESLRWYLVDKLINGTHLIPLFSGDPDVGLYSPQPTNHRLPHRQNRNWQVEEVKATVVRTTYQDPSPVCESREEGQESGNDNPTLTTEDICYFEWLRRSCRRVHRPTTPSKGEPRWLTYDSNCDALSADFRLTVKVGTACTRLVKRWVVPSQADVPPCKTYHGV